MDDGVLLSSLGVLAIVILVSMILARYRRLVLYCPESSIMLLIGLILGAVFKSTGMATHFVFSPSVFFHVFLPPIIFWSGYDINKQHFFRNIGSILTFAFPGTMIATLVIGGMTYATSGLPGMFRFNVVESFAIGSLLSATDPVATISVFSKVGVNPCLFSLVFGEAVFNDAVGLVLYESFADLEPDQSTGRAIGVAIANFLFVVIASTLVGAVIGVGSALLHRYSSLHKRPYLELAVVILTAYSSYIIAEALTLSGIMCILVVSLAVDHYTSHNLSVQCHEASKLFFEMLATLAEASVFVYLGTAVFTFEHSSVEAASVIGLLGWCVLGRVAGVVPLSWLLNRRRTVRIPWKQQVMMCVSGLRGPVAFAMATTFGTNTERVRTMTLIICFVTTMLFGALTHPVVRWLRLSSEQDPYPTITAEEVANHPWVKFDDRYVKPFLRMRLPAVPGTGAHAASTNLADQSAAAALDFASHEAVQRRVGGDDNPLTPGDLDLHSPSSLTMDHDAAVELSLAVSGATAVSAATAAEVAARMPGYAESKFVDRNNDSDAMARSVHSSSNDEHYTAIARHAADARFTGAASGSE